jgi:ubiquinone/menaquinone biosynthesis C-methylase UbiE
MPEENEWKKYFQPFETLTMLGLKKGMTFVDLGCGYGTFTLAASSIVGIKGQVYAVDIDRENVERVAARAKEEGLENVTALVGDITTESGIGLPSHGADFVLLANVIHGTRRRVSLLGKVKNILRVGGIIAILNWKLSETPRGPPMQMRPTPQQSVRYLVQAGFDDPLVLDAPPHHYAVMARYCK